MKIRIVLALLCILGFGWCLPGCEPVVKYEKPFIRFKEIKVVEYREPLLGNIEKKALLTFSFVVSDGNLGVRPIDISRGERFSRIYYTWYPQGSDKPYEFRPDTTTIDHAIPYSEVMNKDGAQNKVLKGTIEIQLETPNQQNLDFMRVEFYITDRAKNESNLERTPDFSLFDISGSKK